MRTMEKGKTTKERPMVALVERNATVHTSSEERVEEVAIYALAGGGWNAALSRRLDDPQVDRIAVLVGWTVAEGDTILTRGAGGYAIEKAHTVKGTCGQEPGQKTRTIGKVAACWREGTPLEGVIVDDATA